MAQWKHRTCMVLVVLLAVFEFILWHKASEEISPDFIESNWGWYVVVPTVALLVTASQWFMSKLLDTSQSAPDDSEVIEIDDSILERWQRVCNEFGIDPDDIRAELCNFPAQLAQILELEEMRKASDDRELRKQLGARVWLIMHETLGPLAAELDYLSTAAEKLQQIHDEADTTLARTLEFVRGTQAVNTARAEMLLATT